MVFAPASRFQFWIIYLDYWWNLRGPSFPSLLANLWMCLTSCGCADWALTHDRRIQRIISIATPLRWPNLGRYSLWKLWMRVLNLDPRLSTHTIHITCEGRKEECLEYCYNRASPRLRAIICALLRCDGCWDKCAMKVFTQPEQVDLLLLQFTCTDWLQLHGLRLKYFLPASNIF